MIRTGAIRSGFPHLLLPAAILLLGAGAVVVAQQPTDPPPNTTAPKPKKVYTNDDVQPAPDGAAAIAKPARSTAPSGKEPNAELARSMRAKLEKLEVQIKDADKQIDDLRRFQAGETNGDASHQWHTG